MRGASIAKEIVRRTDELFRDRARKSVSGAILV